MFATYLVKVVNCMIDVDPTSLWPIIIVDMIFGWFKDGSIVHFNGL